jgi:hypothetical protein
MSCPLVRPETIRLPLSDNDFIDVKAELNAGETHKVWSDMVRGGIKPGEPAELDPERVGRTRLLAYILSWSFVDFDGRPLPVSEATLMLFTNHKYRELADAINQHEAEQDQRRAERQQDPIIATGLRAIS